MPIELKMPALSPTMEEGKLARWLVAVGDSVRAGDLLAEIETDKATMEVEADEDGTLSEVLVVEGTEGVKVGEVIALMASAGEASPAAERAEPKREMREPAPAAAPRAVQTSAAAATAQPIKPVALPSGGKATPLARRIAAANGIDLNALSGSGPSGKILKIDLGLPPVTPAIRAAAAPAVEPPIAYGPPPDVPHAVIELSSMRKTIARRLSEAKRTVPHFYLSIDCNLDPLLALRQQLNADLAETGVKLSVNDMLMKALAVALAEVPDANVQFAGDRLYRFERVDISMAVAVDGGLITPIIADAANKRLSVIAREAKDLAARAREGKLKPPEFQGGTVSISNLGMFGIKEMLPVINPPQGMILGVGAGEKRPYVINDELTVATVMTVTGSFDHRAIDGATGAQLMGVFKRLVEKPIAMLA